MHYNYNGGSESASSIRSRDTHLMLMDVVVGAADVCTYVCLSLWAMRALAATLYCCCDVAAVAHMMRYCGLPTPMAVATMMTASMAARAVRMPRLHCVCVCLCRNYVVAFSACVLCRHVPCRDFKDTRVCTVRALHLMLHERTFACAPCERNAAASDLLALSTTHTVVSHM